MLTLHEQDFQRLEFAVLQHCWQQRSEYCTARSRARYRLARSLHHECTDECRATYGHYNCGVHISRRSCACSRRTGEHWSLRVQSRLKQNLSIDRQHFLLEVWFCARHAGSGRVWCAPCFTSGFVSTSFCLRSCFANARQPGLVVAFVRLHVMRLIPLQFGSSWRK